jgi:hypothetical protein
VSPALTHPGGSITLNVKLVVPALNFRKDVRRFNELLIHGASIEFKNPALTYEIGMLLMNSGNEEIARYWLEKTLQQHPFHRAARQALAAYQEKTDKKKAAARQRLPAP